jgi:AAA+ ATPase superfamily predicted ATPase
MFVAREKELNQLNAIYNSDKFEFIIVYGQRRIGKPRYFVNSKERKNQLVLLQSRQMIS